MPIVDESKQNKGVKIILGINRWLQIWNIIID